MIDLLLLPFAVFWAWEFLLVIVPWRIPAPAQPLLVAGIAYGANYVPDPVLLATAVAGVVALLHLLVRNFGDEGPMLTQVIGRRTGPPQRTSRVPDLP